MFACFVYLFFSIWLLLCPSTEGNIPPELDQFGQGSNLLQFDLNEVYEKGPWRANCSKDLCKPECRNPNAKEYKIQTCNVSLVKGFRKKGIWTNPQVFINTAGSCVTYQSKTTNQVFFGASATWTWTSVWSKKWYSFSSLKKWCNIGFSWTSGLHYLKCKSL